MIKKLISLFLFGTFCLPALAQQPDIATVAEWNNNASIGFSENKGQVTNLSDGTPNSDVLFMMENGDTKLFLLNGGLAWQFNRVHYPAGYQELMSDPSRADQEQVRNMRKDIRIETWRMDMTLVGANTNAKVIAEERSTDFVHYYNRNALDVHSYRKITYQNIYEGIDWVIYLSGSQVKYDFIVHPGADPSRIVIRYSDYETLQLNSDGSVSLGNSMGVITEYAPVSFQNGDQVATQFVLEGNTLRFALGTYNRNETLVIDPIVRAWGTYYGAGNESGFSCTTDAAGNVFLAGTAASLTGIAAGGHQTTVGGGDDAMLVKFTPAGARLWATYYGGSGAESGDACVTDASGNVYMSGYTLSSSSIASGGHQNTSGGSYDIYLVKFDPSGVRLWATYYGGTGAEMQSNCEVDGTGNVYLCGYTSSTSDIASGGHQSAYGGGGNDAFLVKFNAAGVRQWATYYGGTDNDYGRCCVLDASGNVYLTGETYSSGAIASGGHQNTLGGASDAFLVKFNASGVRQWATYYGGTAADGARVCVVDASGNIYIGGSTASTNAISSGGHQSTYGGSFYDGFLVKFNSAGVRQWGTYYGDAGEDVIFSAGLDGDGNIYAAGTTTSTTSIASGGYQNTNAGNRDAFFAVFNPSGVRQWGTYYGGAGTDWCFDFTISSSGVIYICGQTMSNSGIASGGFQNTATGVNAYLVKFTSPPAAALNFDGTNDLVTVPANTVFDFTTGTAECWFNSGVSSGNRCVMGMRTNTSGARWSVHVNENTNEVGFFNGSAFSALPVTINPNTWYHLAVVMNSVSTVVYLNGVNIGTIALGIQTSATGLPFTIGGHTDAAWPEYFLGSIDEVRIWNRALCASEIVSCMSGETPAFSNGLVADYHFNQGYEAANNAGITTLTDASGNNCTGTLLSFALNGTTSNWIAPGGITTGSNATPVITASVSSSANVTCNGGNNGSATVTASGTGPFTYSWAPSGGSAATATGLAAGTYSCTISNGCVSTISTVTITQPTPISLSGVVTHISCSSPNDGAINLTVTGGTGPFTYAWSSGYMTEDISGLYPGTYSVTVTDANGCTATSSQFSVSYASTLSSSVNVTPIACNGGTTTATMIPSGGTAPYTYSWSPSGGNGATSTPIGPGMYFCTVTDANGCNSSQSFILTQPAVLTASATVTSNYNGYPISCLYNADGAVSSVVSGGTGPYTYQWSNGMISPNINNISGGTYTYTVTDVNGCSAVAYTTVNQPPALNVSFTATPVDCNGNTTGAINMGVSGGVGGYSYNWSNSATTEDISGLAPGSYSVTVTDLNGCTTTGTTTVTQPPVLTSSSSATSIACHGGTATVTVSGSGGTSPYTGAGTFTVTAGTYSYPVTDANGCVSTTSITVTEPAMLNATSSATPILCNGGSTAVIVSASGGTAPYIGEGTFTQTAGTYSYPITDANGCAASTLITVTEPAVFTASSAATPVLCNGGTSTVTVSGAGGTSPYSGEGMFTETAGTFSYTLTDANGCTSTTSITVTEPAVLSVAISNTANPTSCGGTDGSIDISVTGGTTSYTFLWSNNDVTEDLSAIGAGTYSVIVTDANGCTAGAMSSVTDPGAPMVTLALPLDTLCGDQPGTIILSGESPAGGTFSGTAVTGNTFDPFTAGTGMHYITYTFTDINGCTGSTTDSIYVDGCMGVESAATTAWSLFPNPTNGELTIQTSADINTNVVVEVYTSEGKLLTTENKQAAKTFALDLATEPAGVYFIRITANGKATMHRVVKM